MQKVIKIDDTSVGLRIDKWIKFFLTKIPQSLVEKDLRNGKIKVNKKKVKSSYKLKKSDQIFLFNISYKILSRKKIRHAGTRKRFKFSFFPINLLTKVSKIGKF